MRYQFIVVRDFLNSLDPIVLFHQLSKLGKMETIFIYSFLECNPKNYPVYALWVDLCIVDLCKPLYFMTEIFKLAIKKLKRYKESNSEMIGLYRDLKMEFSALSNLRDFFLYFNSVPFFIE